MKTINLEIYKFEELLDYTREIVIDSFIKTFYEDDIIFKYLFNKIEDSLKSYGF